jgi:hypothetical protein
MFTRHRTQRLFQIAAAASLFVAADLVAQDRPLLTWSGRVDKEAQITIRDTTISTSIIGGLPVVTSYFAVKDRLPQRDGTVRVEIESGRGDVDVIQQPSAANQFAAVIRIRDHSVGVDTYTLKAFWNPNRGEDRYSSAAAVRANADATPANTMRWTGTVDRDLTIEWRGYDVMSKNGSGEAAREVHSSVSNALPSSNSRVELSIREGRGDVSVLQQPTSANGYTAILRIRDPQTGMGRYNFDLTWR